MKKLIVRLFKKQLEKLITEVIMSVSTGTWLGKNQKEVETKLANISDDGNTFNGPVNTSETVTAGVVITDDLTVNEIARFTNLDTSDPLSPGTLWNDSGTVKISL